MQKQQTDSEKFPTSTKHFNKAVRLIREYQRLSKTELAKRLKIPCWRLAALENGESSISLNMLLRFSSAFNLPLDSLVLFAEARRRKYTHDKLTEHDCLIEMLYMYDWLLDETRKYWELDR